MKTVVLTFLLLIISTGLFAQTVADLNLFTEEYPPFNFTEDGKLQGVATDTLAEMLKMVDSSNPPNKISALGWARGYSLALTKKNAVLFSMARTEAREGLFKWVGPIIQSRIVLLAKKGRNIKVKSIEEINENKYRVGVVLDDVGEQALLALGVNKGRIHRFLKAVYLAKSLHLGSIDMLAYDKVAALWNIKGLGYAQADYEEIYTLKNIDYYYAFNKDTDDEIITKLQTALDKLKEGGRFDIISNRYLSASP